MDNKKDQYFLFSSLASALLFGVGLYNYKEKKRLQRKEKTFKNQRIYTPDEIINIIEKNEPLFHKLFQRNEDGNKFIGKKLIIQGQINNQDCLKSVLEMKKDIQLIMRINYDFPYYTNQDTYQILSEKTMNSDYYIKKKELGTNLKIKIQPVILLQKNNAQCQVVLKENFKKIDKQCFDYADSQMILDNTSGFKKVWNVFGLLLAGIADVIFKQDIRDFLCFRIKVDSCEIGIRNQGIISVLGDIVYNKDRGELTIANPLRLMKNKLEQLGILKQKITTKQNLSFILYFSSLLASGASLYLLYQQVQFKTHLTFFGRQYQVPVFVINFMRRIRNRIHARNPNSKNSQEIVELVQENKNGQSLESVYTQPREEMECIICYQRCRSVIIRPCLHCSMCYRCYISLQKKECPVCKSPIKNQTLLFQQNESINSNNNKQKNNSNNSNNNNNQNNNNNNNSGSNNHQRRQSSV